jgi:hypothetical protein
MNFQKRLYWFTLEIDIVHVFIEIHYLIEINKIVHQKTFVKD